MASARFLKKRKALFIKGKFHDKEELIKVAKSQAAAIGVREKIIVVDIGSYNPDLDGQSVTVEHGSEYILRGSGRTSIKK